MKYIFTSALLISSAFASVVPRDNKKVDYSGFKILRLENTAGLEAKINELSVHVLNPGKSAQLEVVVSPDNVDAISSLTESKVINDDVGAMIAEEGEMGVYAVPSESWFTAYHTYADHLAFLRDLQASYTGNSRIITSGTSVEGRVITGIHIWGSGGQGSKPAVLIHGTVHAREWITTMSTEYFAWQLLTKYATDANIKAVVDKFDFYIMPIVNPDGFVYSQTRDRLWRKNRKINSGSSCVGTDINRNWPYKWEVTGGASTNPCEETYRGQAAGDTPENRGLVAQVQSLKNSRGIRLYLDIHSFGQYILWPYGYDCRTRPDNEAAHRTLATNAAAAIRAVTGVNFAVGPSCSTLYATTGSSTDYTDATGNATYSYTYELRDKGVYEFTLPANQIQPAVRETWAGVFSMFQAV